MTEFEKLNILSKIICLCSTATHYSVFKAADLVNVGIEKIEID